MAGRGGRRGYMLLPPAEHIMSAAFKLVKSTYLSISPYQQPMGSSAQPPSPRIQHNRRSRGLATRNPTHESWPLQPEEGYRAGSPFLCRKPFGGWEIGVHFVEHLKYTPKYEEAVPTVVEAEAWDYVTEDADQPYISTTTRGRLMGIILT